MRIDINLASHPYEDLRRFLKLWGPVVAAMAIFTLALLAYVAAGWMKSGPVRAEMKQLRADIAALEEESKAAEKLVSQPQNQQVREQARFVNGLIARKAFSWTKALAALEKIVPARVQVVSIQPELNGMQQLEIRMVVAATTREHVLDLVRRLEESERFRRAQVSSESTETQGGTSDVEFEIVAVYVPEVPARGAP
ncbi:MAG: PilN domain-containing protein [Acidobacteria bacterium]|nr:PilN domain-containing protein [Acidobacteriota bacterium]